MNPGVAAAWTTCLPQSPASRVTAAATAGSVARPLTTSTSRITGAGLKKCMPTRRPGWMSPAAIAVGDSDEVLVASTQPGDDQHLQVGEQGLLDGQVLGYRLDHAFRVGQLAEFRGRPQPQAVRIAVEAAPGDQPRDPALHRGDRPAGGALHGVVHRDRVAGHGGDLDDAGAHGPGPDDRDRGGPADPGHGTGSPRRINVACARRSTRRILPVAVVGYSVTNTIRRGRL